MQTLRAAQAVTSSLETLRAALGKDRTEKHALIVSHVGIILALALVNQAPKGHGNPADWKALPAMFAGVGAKAYAEHCAAFPQFFAETKPRSVGDWETAQDIGYAAAVAAFAGCAPRTVTPEQAAKRAETKAAKAQAKADETKAQERAERERNQEAMRKAELAGRNAALAELTAQQVADLIRAGHFDTSGLVVIMDAIPASEPA